MKIPRLVKIVFNSFTDTVVVQNCMPVPYLIKVMTRVFFTRGFYERHNKTVE
jgi:hypothetical protein